MQDQEAYCPQCSKIVELDEDEKCSDCGFGDEIAMMLCPELCCWRGKVEKRFESKTGAGGDVWIPCETCEGSGDYPQLVGEVKLELITTRPVSLDGWNKGLDEFGEAVERLDKLVGVK